MASLPIRSPKYMAEAYAIKRKYKEGLKIREVAELFNMTPVMATVRLREAGGSTRPTSQNGYNHKGPIEVHELDWEPISYKALAEQTGLAIRTLLRWAVSGKIPAHFIEGKYILCAAEIAEIDMMALKYSRRVIESTDNRPRCQRCGIVLVNESGKDGSHEKCPYVCNWCIDRCNCEAGNWTWKRGIVAIE